MKVRIKDKPATRFTDLENGDTFKKIDPENDTVYMKAIPVHRMNSDDIWNCMLIESGLFTFVDDDDWVEIIDGTFMQE